MAIYVKYNNDFEQTEPIVRECPHCGVHAPLIPVATPAFSALSEARPQHAGVAFRCSACNEPRFARAAVRSYSEDLIVLSANLVEVERPKEHFQYGYLPKAVARVLTEAFGCYAADLRLAFATLCRLAITRAAAAGHEGEAATFRTLFDDACRLASVDDATRASLAEALFGTGTEPDITPDEAAILVELIKDMFQQRFVRTAKLRRAIEMRRFFAAEPDENVTPIAAFPPRANSSEH